MRGGLGVWAVFVIFLSVCHATYEGRNNRTNSSVNTQHRGCRIQLENYCRRIIDAFCENHRCVCPPNMIINFDHTRCLNTSQEFGAECESHRQCTHVFGDGAHCVNGTCGCQREFSFSRTTNKCFFITTSRELGARCEGHYQCTHVFGDGARCLDGRCGCQREFSFNRTTKKCVFIMSQSRVSNDVQEETDCADGHCNTSSNTLVFLELHGITASIAGLIMISLVLLTVQLCCFWQPCSLYLRKLRDCTRKNLDLTKDNRKHVTFKEVLTDKEVP
ncbi:scavenger receptor class F member 2 [Anabrus simplex]|uniref:scavenger receptor class F member 2 n=1 Tax=Anabrus simplex TaxID=316456 RepID=UPI0035A303FF